MAAWVWLRTLVSSVPFVLVSLVVLFLGFTEIDRVGAQFPGSQSNTLSILGMTGPTAFTTLGGWEGWAAADGTPIADLLPTPWLAIVLYLVLDAFFIVLYAYLLCRGIQRWMPKLLVLQTPPSREQHELTARRRRGWFAFWVLIGADLAEDIGLGFAAGLLHGNDVLWWWLPGALAFFSTLKFAGMLLVLLAFLRARPFVLEVGRVLSRGWHAAYPQRLSVVVVLVLAALSLLPPWHEVLEQLPDVQRGWADGTVGTQHFVFALAAATVLAFVSFLLGRKRAQLYWETRVLGRGDLGPARQYGATSAQLAANPALARLTWPRWRYLIWAVPFVTVAVLGFVLWRTGNGDSIDEDAFRIFLIATGGILVLSLILEGLVRAFGQAKAAPRDADQEGDREFVLRVSKAGDVLAALVLVVSALGAARSFGSVAVVRLVSGETAEGLLALLLVLLFIVLAVAVGRIPSLIAIASTVTPNPIPAAVAKKFRNQVRREFDPRRDTPTITTLGVWIVVLVITGSVVAIGVLGFLPLEVAPVIGVVAVMIVLLGSITSLLGLIVLSLRRRRPLALFELLGFRSDPVIALVLIVPLLAGQLSGSVALHAVDLTASTDEDAVDRRTLSEAFDDWLVRSDSCDVVVNGISVRPLVLVAAEGGGIRAATWTVATMAEFARRGECAANSVFLSSGASGGSVGLAIAATLDRTESNAGAAEVPASTGTNDEYAKAVVEEVKALGQSGTLPAATVGLVGSDPLAATTGIRLGTATRWNVWRDRAALIEDAWRETAPGLDVAWDPQPSAPTGLIVLNSADILSGCRVSVSQVVLGEGVNGSTTELPHDDAEGDASRPRCDQGSAEPPLTIDFIDFFADECSVALDWATAAMLSARFPVVTPGGVVDRGVACGTEPDIATNDDRLHLVDGGYAENSGLGLLADIAPNLARIVTHYNSDERLEGEPIVVPYVMYIENSPGAYLAARDRESVPELTVPLAGAGTKATQVTPNSWIERVMASLGDLCRLVSEKDTENANGAAEPEAEAPAVAGPEDCAENAALLTGTSNRVVIAAAGTRPSVAVPLGWGLSQATYGQLAADAISEALVKGFDADGNPDPQAKGCAPPAWSEYQCVGQLLALFPADPN